MKAKKWIKERKLRPIWVNGKLYGLKIGICRPHKVPKQNLMGIEATVFVFSEIGHGHIACESWGSIKDTYLSEKVAEYVLHVFNNNLGEEK